MTTSLITDRRPTKRDADETGEVLWCLKTSRKCPTGGWVGLSWDAETEPCEVRGWTHTPLWVDPGPDMKEQLEKDLNGLKECLWDVPALAAFNRIATYVHSQLAKADEEAP